ncbi:hypothetical protein GQ55_1G041300 [Panicum hallii var. hallii]|uniref:EF-hand domain-containing protein n=1 Tax=Panicum hallii var. hallii TaxID=1504633 RepID=A0A2T7F233_9POAL|nr:hypothetical protein GQ55_1G041300 [Panicum hallii var. hallii]
MAPHPTRTRGRGRGKTEGRRPVRFLSHLRRCSCSCSSPRRRRRRRRPSTTAGRREMEIARAAAGVACSKKHQRIYAEWFALADPDGDGRVTGADATSFFGMSGLSRADLKQVWAIADSKRQGYLGFAEFVTAMQLVSLAQAGNEITQDSLKREDLSTLDPPVMEGVDELVAVSLKSSDSLSFHSNDFAPGNTML